MDRRSPFGYCSVEISEIFPFSTVIWTWTGPQRVWIVSPLYVPDVLALCFCGVTEAGDCAALFSVAVVEADEEFEAEVVDELLFELVDVRAEVVGAG